MYSNSTPFYVLQARKHLLYGHPPTAKPSPPLAKPTLSSLAPPPLVAWADDRPLRPEVAVLRHPELLPKARELCAPRSTCALASWSQRPPPATPATPAWSLPGGPAWRRPGDRPSCSLPLFSPYTLPAAGQRRPPRLAPAPRLTPGQLQAGAHSRSAQPPIARGDSLLLSPPFAALASLRNHIL